MFITTLRQAIYNEIGLPHGYPDGSFKPENNITRAEVVSLVNRMLDRKCDVNYVDKHADAMKQYTDLNKTHWTYYQIFEASNAHDYTTDASGETWTDLQ